MSTDLEQSILDQSHSIAAAQPSVEIQIVDLGLIEYEVALKLQYEYLQKKINGDPHDYLLVCSHPPIVTLGSATQDDDVFAWQGPIIKVTRGGRATYHGPSQLVVYPIIDLQKKRTHLPTPNISKFFRLLEGSIIKTLSFYEIVANGNVTSDPQNTGVWILNKKIASLGIGVKKWITYHGLAINLDYDPDAFVGLKPCGFSSDTMTSLEVQLGHQVDRENFKKRLTQELLNSLS